MASSPTIKVEFVIVDDRKLEYVHERGATPAEWLIESASPQGVPQYWDGRKHNSFTIDPNEAVRFARFKDAERVRAWMLFEPIRDHCRSVEHLWIAPPEATQ